MYLNLQCYILSRGERDNLTYLKYVYLTSKLSAPKGQLFKTTNKLSKSSKGLFVKLAWNNGSLFSQLLKESDSLKE